VLTSDKRTHKLNYILPVGYSVRTMISYNDDDDNANIYSAVMIGRTLLEFTRFIR